MPRSVATLPKAHLHLHFTGSMRHTTLLELAERDGHHLPDALVELEQRGVPHGAGEMQVEMGLRKLYELPQDRLSGFALVVVSVVSTRHPREPLTFSAAASSTQVATASIAELTSAGSGKVGASRMLRSRGSSPFGNEEPAGVSAMPASLASETTREAVPSSTSRLTK